MQGILTLIVTGMITVAGLFAAAYLVLDASGGAAANLVGDLTEPGHIVREYEYYMLMDMDQEMFQLSNVESTLIEQIDHHRELCQQVPGTALESNATDREKWQVIARRTQTVRENSSPADPPLHGADPAVEYLRTHPETEARAAITKRYTTGIGELEDILARVQQLCSRTPTTAPTEDPKDRYQGK